MNRELIAFLLEGAKALQSDTEKDNWHGIKRGEFLFAVAQLTNKEDLDEAIAYLQKISTEELLYPTIPPKLEELVKDLDNYRQQMREKSPDQLAEVLRRLRTRIVQLQLEQAGVETTETVYQQEMLKPQEEQPEEFLPPKPFVRLPTTPLAHKPGAPTPPPPAVPAQSSISPPPQTTAVYLTKVPLGISIPQTIVHTLVSFPLQSFRMLVALGQEALGKQQGPVLAAATSLIWKTGLTSKALRRAITTYQKAPTSEREVVEALIQQANVLETYETEQPFFSNIASFLNRSQDSEIVVTHQRPEEGVELTVDKNDRAVTGTKTLLRPRSFSSFINTIAESPILRTAAAPARSLAANLATRLQIAIRQAPIEIGRAIFPSGPEALQAGGPPGFPSVPTPPPTPFGVPSVSARFPGAAPGWFTRTLGGAGRPIAFGLQTIGMGTIRGGLGLIMGAGRFFAGIGSLFAGGGAAAGVGVAAGAGAAAGGGTVLVAGAIIGVVVLLLFGFLNITTHQSAYLQAGVIGAPEQPNSPYIQVTKAASPTSIKNDQLPASITFTVKITAPQTKLSNIQISDEITVAGSSGSPKITSPLVNYPKELNGGESATLQYILEARIEFKDSILSNLITVVADVPEKGLTKEQSRANSSVIIGTPPTFCFVFQGDWEPNERVIEQQAINILARSAQFMKKLCGDSNERTIRLVRNRTNPGYRGFHEVQGSISIITIYMNDFLTNVWQSAYLLGHEAGHAYDRRNPSLMNDFRASMPSGLFIHTYPFAKDRSEDFAEMVGVYVAWRNAPIINCCVMKDFSQRYTQHYQFAKEKIFGGVEF